MPIGRKNLTEVSGSAFLSKTDNICSLPCDLATYLIAVCKDTTEKMGRGGKCVFLNIWYINVKHRWYGKKTR